MDEVSLKTGVGLFWKLGVVGILSSVLTLSSAVSVAKASHLTDEDREDFSEDGIDEYREWLRNRSSSVRRKINDLDDDPVEDLPIPILFGVTLGDIMPNFGDPRGGGTRSHEGLDMLAPLGTPIVSPTEAVVLRTGSGSSAGKYVYTANPGDETFVYMHLDDIADLEVGEVLDVGELVGFVGDTGNANGVSHLHLEIREGGATDPYPRITEEFELDEKMEFLEDILADVRDEEELAEFLVEVHPGVFLLAQSEDIKLPREIENALEDADLSVSLDDIDRNLSAGDSGNDVIALQTFLISTNIGTAARELAGAGATGYFGPITKAALIEYQKEVGISPANGVFRVSEYGSAAVSTNGAGPRTDTDAGGTFGVIATLTPNDLSVGNSGLEVQLLQLFLMIKNTGPRAAKLWAASATGYFGPITSAAFLEYQIANNIIPATGSYDSRTRAYILNYE